MAYDLFGGGVSQGRQGVCVSYTAAASKFSDHGQRSRLRPAEANRTKQPPLVNAHLPLSKTGLWDAQLLESDAQYILILTLTATRSPVLGSPMTRVLVVGAPGHPHPFVISASNGLAASIGGWPPSCLISCNILIQR